jgi:hypothetical protein
MHHERMRASPRAWLARIREHAGPLRLWLGTFGDRIFVAAFSQQNVARELDQHGTPIVAPLPRGALAGPSVTDIPHCIACCAAPSSSARQHE